MAAPHDISVHAIEEAKAALRRRARQLRTGQDPRLGARLADHLLAGAALPPAAAIAGFWPLAGEIDLRPLMQALRGRGHAILLPETPAPGQPLSFRHWNRTASLSPGRFGTMVPDGALGTPDVVLLPLLAFDADGHRLGYGGGYYDRTLARLPHAWRIGCGFAAQEVDAVPSGPYDMPLHAMATEFAYRRFGGAGMSG